MEKALSAQHTNAANSLLAAILCGGLSASGGGIMGKTLSHMHTHNALYTARGRSSMLYKVVLIADAMITYACPVNASV
jgi:hypothetical protein